MMFDQLTPSSKLAILINHFWIWLSEGGFHSIITGNGFGEYGFQSSLGLGLDSEPGFESRVWFWTLAQSWDRDSDSDWTRV